MKRYNTGKKAAELFHFVNGTTHTVLNSSKLKEAVLLIVVPKSSILIATLLFYMIKLQCDQQCMVIFWCDADVYKNKNSRNIDESYLLCPDTQFVSELIWWPPRKVVLVSFALENVELYIVVEHILLGSVSVTRLSTNFALSTTSLKGAVLSFYISFNYCLCFGCLCSTLVITCIEVLLLAESAIILLLFGVDLYMYIANGDTEVKVYDLVLFVGRTTPALSNMVLKTTEAGRSSTATKREEIQITTTLTVLMWYVSDVQCNQQHPRVGANSFLIMALSVGNWWAMVNFKNGR